MTTLQTLGQQSLFALETMAVLASALSGVLGALRQRMDLVGICVCGFLAAFGGGVLRDILIDRRPFFFVEHQGVLLAVLLLSVGSAVLVGRRGLEAGERWLRIPDAIGLGLFSATGVHLSWAAGQPPLVAILMGVITGSFGGVLRDLICNEIPALFRDHRPYAICAAAGGATYAAATLLQVPTGVAIAACAIVTAGLRILAVQLDWRLPPTERS
ncbi:MAG: trimeric intracellular cation channel family protein [Phenylobacterium sp.]